MRNTFSLLVGVAIVASLASGCARMETKLGRGLSNSFEFARGGEMRRTMEQTALFDSPDTSYTTGFIRGVNRTLARTGVGIYEVVTAPLPPYGPIFTGYLEPSPVYPDNYTPGLVADSMFATDTYAGFSGGDVLPFVPGNRFQVFESH
jgi:putative exosortase-associated protein (TIGR04073 family)